MNYVIAIVIGFIIAFVVVNVMKGGLTSVIPKREANNYVIKESVHIRNTYDNFVRKELEKKERPKENTNS